MPTISIKTASALGNCKREKIYKRQLSNILQTMNEPFIQVGILLEKPAIRFSLLSDYRLGDALVEAGTYSVEGSEGKMVFRGERYDEIVLQPVDPHKNAFELKDVTIGVNFHWERKEDQRFLGGLKFIVENDAVTAINIVALEDYLTSVISSEMSATSSKQLLKAHAVIFAQLAVGSNREKQID